MTVVLGLTGSFGSGKSTVASIFDALGVPRQDADQIARDVVRPGTRALDEIVEAFGQDVLDAEGTMDREKMAKIVFSDEEARQRLNSIIHPRVRERMKEFIEDHAGEPLVVVEIPLLLEGGRSGTVDKVVVVTTSESIRFERLAGLGFSEEQIQARLGAQMPQEEKITLADHVIDNGGSLEATREQVVELAGLYGIGS
ncbi:dephospho-CoA kinase [Candidatus Sumerlaeota bacterium]|nr:dephospho-CoA kinase [Candidatus Sumerlaeota bacterium]